MFRLRIWIKSWVEMMIDQWLIIYIMEWRENWKQDYIQINQNSLPLEWVRSLGGRETPMGKIWDTLILSKNTGRSYREESLTSPSNNNPYNPAIKWLVKLSPLYLSNIHELFSSFPRRNLEDLSTEPWESYSKGYDELLRKGNWSQDEKQSLQNAITRKISSEMI